ncbi:MULTISPECIES: helix-turn-helix domain-containing protein [unclassified Halomonas]|uniref:helix-turn-helix domain-containing protein n=1 Tax=unclassified Halomonas TaxID=2609666 RepID=UPI0007F09FE3|nr:MULTISPECIES: helix-turn-helix domain-containing protein [unclassified Halomonas]SBR51574.1 CRP/FNR family transcriptional regulator, anaerobic regulatory protein [Halomonas sp. HL-93]SNY97415.1 CRP/FNR family transcriptional regulator, anaerobic regulatory protein [Halomonas sp. hl-4]
MDALSPSNRKKENAYYHSGTSIIEDLNNLTQPSFILNKRNILIHQGRPFQGLYVVHCGTLKQLDYRKKGEETLTHFFLPGDIIGLDAIEDGFYSGSVTAIETSGLLPIPFSCIEELLNTHSQHIRLLRCLSKAIRYAHTRMWQIVNQPSDARLAFFVIDMSCHFQARGYSPYCFRLAMSRREIAAYLCMALETLSRLISRFQQQGILSARGHEYCILNPEGLAAIAERLK